MTPLRQTQRGLCKLKELQEVLLHTDFERPRRGK